jgi:hypothetical protein
VNSFNNLVVHGLALVTLFSLAGASFAQGVELVSPSKEAAAVGGKTYATERLNALRAQRGVLQTSVIRVNKNALFNNVVNITLPGGKRVTVHKSREEIDAAGRVVWFGKVERTSQDVIFVLTSHGLSGLLDVDGVRYRIEPLDSESHLFIKSDPDSLPPDHPPEAPVGVTPPIRKEIAPNSSRPASSSFAPSSAETSSAIGATQLDVVVMYTAKGRAKLGLDPLAAITSMVAELNQSYINSQVQIIARLVGTAPSSIVELSGPANTETTLNSFHASAEARTFRDSKGGDVAVLIADLSDACGLAKGILTPADAAFAVADADCAWTNKTFSHEIGHIQGAKHDSPITSVPTSYGHGYVSRPPYPPYSVVTRPVPCFRTIMAYDAFCFPESTSMLRAPRVNYWSNPSVIYSDGFATAPAGNAVYANNARVLNATAATVAAFRSPPATGGGGSGGSSGLTKAAKDALAAISIMMLD